MHTSYQFIHTSTLDISYQSYEVWIDYFTMPRGQTCWRLGLVMYLNTKVPRGQSCWRLGLTGVPYYYFTMPRGQTCWWLGLVIYLISKVPRGQYCWRLGLADVPYYYFTMPRGQTCWKLGLCWCTLLLFYHAHRPDFLADEKHLQNNTVANTKTKKLGKSHLKRVNLENSMSTHIWTWIGTGRTSTSQTLL